jgi:hypothetical protein
MTRRFGINVLLGILAMAGALANCAGQTTSDTSKTNRPSPEQILKEAAAKPSAPFEGTGWKPLFDGQTLKGWQATEFAGHGEVHCESGMVVLGTGNDLTGVNYTNDVPKVNYEISMDAMRVQGSDFFCGLTVPVKDSFCSLILGGWGGSVTGISSVDGEDASENETTKFMRFESGRWYRLRLRVTDKKIEAWLDKEKIVDLATTGRKIGLRFGEIEMSKPLGIASWETAGALREIRMRRIEADGGGKK